MDTNTDVAQCNGFDGEKFRGPWSMYYNPAYDANYGNDYLRTHSQNIEDGDKNTPFDIPHVGLDLRGVPRQTREIVMREREYY